MTSVSKKVAERLVSGLKKYQPVLTAARARDINESDTVLIVTDILQEIFGYDKYTELSSEHSIRSTFCDLAIKLDGDIAFLIEVKAIGHDLKDNYVKQAVDYAANQGVEWVGLTNGVVWRVYRVTFSKPIDFETVVEFDLLTLNPRSDEHLLLLSLLAKEGWQKARLGDYFSQRQALSRFVLGALLLSETVLDVLRREVRRLSPDIRVDAEQIESALIAEVIKRDVLEGEKAEHAKKQVTRAANRQLRSTKANKSEGSGSRNAGK